MPTETTDYRKQLRASRLFVNLTDSEIEKALELLSARYALYGKGDYLHRPYTEMNRFGLVLSGVVQVCMDDVEGNRMIMAEVLPGITFGESLCFLSVKESPVYVYATEPAAVFWFSTEKLFHSRPDEFTLRLQRQFTEMLATRTLSMNNRIQVLSKIRLRDKLITYFSQLSQASRGYTVQIPMNREDLATYIGTNRSALSRELARMKQDGLIDYHQNTIQILQ